MAPLACEVVPRSQAVQTVDEVAPDAIANLPAKHTVHADAKRDGGLGWNESCVGGGAQSDGAAGGLVEQGGGVLWGLCLCVVSCPASIVCLGGQ